MLNDRIVAINTIINGLVKQNDTFKKDPKIDNDVKMIIKEILNSQMKSLAKQMRKEYSIIGTDAILMKRNIRAFESRFCDNK